MEWEGGGKRREGAGRMLKQRVFSGRMSSGHLWCQLMGRRWEGAGREWEGAGREWEGAGRSGKEREGVGRSGKEREGVGRSVKRWELSGKQAGTAAPKSQRSDQPRRVAGVRGRSPDSHTFLIVHRHLCREGVGRSGKRWEEGGKPVGLVGRVVSFVSVFCWTVKTGFVRFSFVEFLRICGCGVIVGERCLSPFNDATRWEESGKELIRWEESGKGGRMETQLVTSGNEREGVGGSRDV